MFLVRKLKLSYGKKFKIDYNMLIYDILMENKMTLGNSIYEGLIREGINTSNFIETFNNLDKLNQKTIWKNLTQYKNIMLRDDRKKVFNFFDNVDLWNSSQDVDDEIYNNLPGFKKDKQLHDYFSKKTSLLNWSEQQWDFFHQYSYDVNFYKDFLFFYGHKKTFTQWLEVIKNVKEKNKTQSISEIMFNILNQSPISKWNTVIETIKNYSEETKVKCLKGILNIDDNFQSRNKMNLVIEVIVKDLSEKNKEWFILESLNKPIMNNCLDMFDIYLKESTINLFNKIRNSDLYLLENHKKSINKLEDINFSTYIWLNQYNPPPALINSIIIKWLKKARNEKAYISLNSNGLTKDKKEFKINKILFETVYELFTNKKELSYKISPNLYAYMILYCIKMFYSHMLSHMIGGLQYEDKEFKRWVNDNIFTAKNLEPLKMVDGKKIEVRLKDHQNILKKHLQEYQAQVFSMILDEELKSKETSNKKIKL